MTQAIIQSILESFELSDAFTTVIEPSNLEIFSEESQWFLRVEDLYYDIDNDLEALRIFLACEDHGADYQYFFKEI